MSREEHLEKIAVKCREKIHAAAAIDIAAICAWSATIAAVNFLRRAPLNKKTSRLEAEIFAAFPEEFL